MTYASPSTLPELLRASVEKNPQSLALRFADRQWSYAEFEREVDRVANGFLRIGVQKGDRIAFVLPNCAEFLFAVFAVTKIGAVFVPLNPAYTPEEAEYVLHHSEASIILTSTDLLPLIESVRSKLSDLKQLIVLGDGMFSQTLSWNEFLRDVGDKAPSFEIAPEDLASITYTSGTTDRPKGVMLSHYAYAFAPRTRAEALGWTAKDRVLCLLPLFHVNAL
jgi:acyl-CoA synthetase (AMP-forming)/AMP-acid ligase II